MMHIEIIGCTSAGKSSLIRDILKENRLPGYQLSTSYDFVLSWAHFDWVKNQPARKLLLNLLALLACLFTWRENHAFYSFLAGAIWRLPGDVSLREKIKIARITARNAGIYEIVHRGITERQIVLADEGTLHIANYLFVHTGIEPNLADLQSFARLVCLPDAAVYVRQPESVLVSRTLLRGHKRIPTGDAELACRFIRHSLAVFENLAASSNLADKLVIVNGEALIEPDGSPVKNPKLELVRDLFDYSVHARLN